MAERAPTESWFTWQRWGLVVAALAGGVTLLPQSPLSSSRPESKPGAESILIGDQTVEARLWQDPLAAVQRHLQTQQGAAGNGEAAAKDRGKAEKPGFKELANQLKWHLQSTGRAVCVLGVMIEGAPYAEDAEARLRYRHAALSALATEDFVGVDPEHLGFIEVPWRRTQSVRGAAMSSLPADAPTAGDSEREERLLIPFEWLKRAIPAGAPTVGGEREDLLVLWLKDEAFGDYPLARLAQLIDRLRNEVRAAFGSSSPPAAVQFKIIGPRKSATLHAMLAEHDPATGKIERGEGAPVAVSDVLQDVPFFSPFATAADAILLPASQLKGRAATARELAQHGVSFYNTTVTDDELAGVLVHELELRGVPLAETEQPPCVALISEWDTLYGRSLPRVFAAKVAQRRQRKHEKSRAPLAGFLQMTASIDPRWPAGIKRFSYLRGLDGKLPGQASESKPQSETSQKTTTPAEEKKRDLEALQRPEGNSQLDYIPRLVTRLREVEAESLRRGRGELQAIGVLGSDVYDKLLILQSLRPHFPRAIFFTTDLDARLLHPKELKWTRNLLVASSFGLRLHEDLQGGIPPFRDCYQSALFLACLAATDRPAAQIEPENLAAKKRAEILAQLKKGEDQRILKPRVFEIGQRGEFDLSFTRDPAGVHPRRLLLPWLEPPSRPLLIRNILFVSLMLAAVGYLAWRLSDIWRYTLRLVTATVTGRQPAPFNTTGQGKYRCLVWGACLLPLCYAALVLCAQTRQRGEPFSLFAGISLWPAETIRLAAAMLCLAFFFRARVRLIENKEFLCQKFLLPPRPITPWPPWRTWLWGAFFDKENRIANWRSDDPPRDTDGRVDAAAVWEKYNELGVVWRRWGRIVPNVLLFFFTGTLLIQVWGGPFRPFRGSFSSAYDLVTVRLSVPLLIALLFYVVDAARLCRGMIEKLTKYESVYPPKAVARFAARWCLPEHLLDEWLDVQIVGQRTKVVGELIYYPFIILLLMIVSRSNYFDRWDWPPALVFILGINAAMAVYAVYQLRYAAERARANSLERLKQKLLCALDQSPRPPANPGSGEVVATATSSKGAADQIRLVIKEIEDYSEGAFAPLSRQPVFGALLMPFGGASALAVFDHLTLS